MRKNNAKAYFCKVSHHCFDERHRSFLNVFSLKVPVCYFIHRGKPFLIPSLFL